MKIMIPRSGHIALKTMHVFASATLIISLAYIGCATAQKSNQYKNSARMTLSSKEALRSPEQIDRYTTYAVYFKLEKAVDKIAVELSADYIADITGVKKTRKTYFIVEKIIQHTQLKNKNTKNMTTEMGRNYDADWNREKEITILSKTSEPFKSIDDASLYKIRFTTFSTENFDFTIKIMANCAVTFVTDAINK